MVCQDEFHELAVRFFNFEFNLITPAIEHALRDDREKGLNQPHCRGHHGFRNTVRNSASAAAHSTPLRAAW